MSFILNENNTGMIEVTLPGGKKTNVPKGILLSEFSERFEKDYRTEVVAAKVNNDIKELSYQLQDDCRVQFIDLTNEDGMRIYRRSLYFILIKAVNDLYPHRKVVLSHSISKGVYCEINGDSELTEVEVKKIEEWMRELADRKIPFIKHMMSLEESKEIFIKSGRMDRFHAIEYRSKPYTTIYSCDGYDDYFYGYMVPDTGYIKKFTLKHYPPGLVIQFPQKDNPDVLPEFKEQKRLFSIFKEFKQWGHILGFDNVGDLNDIVVDGRICDLMRISEALHEKKIAQIADMITDGKDRKRVVLISGPSSSGKTTFANRLGIQLRVNGYKPTIISLDDYFLDRSYAPLDENGFTDFEALGAIDVKLFNRQLADLICGNEVEIPVYNFISGCRESVGRKLKIDGKQILLIEGIHGLNEKLTAAISKKDKFKIYVSALTSLNIDDHNRIPTNDTRLIRRLVRDHQFRGSDAVGTISRWPSVRRGEEKNIFPYQEEADVMFNSALVYELGVLKAYAEPLLLGVDNTHEEYSEVRRLIEFLSYFLVIETKEIPMNSIIREFIGGSCFY